MQPIILAAGRGSRLRGITAPYMKPLVVLNGESLIGKASRFAMSICGVPPIIVAAPENAMVISQVLNDHVEYRMIIQPRPTGPGDALLLALDLALDSDSVLVLMGDNAFESEDISQFATSQASVAVGTQRIEPEKVERFTRARRRNDGGINWVEKVPVTEQDIFSPEGKAVAWVGPLLLPVRQTRVILRSIGMNAQGELPISPILNALEKIYDVEMIPVSTYDIGVPEEL